MAMAYITEGGYITEGAPALRYLQDSSAGPSDGPFDSSVDEMVVEQNVTEGASDEVAAQTAVSNECEAACSGSMSFNAAWTGMQMARQGLAEPEAWYAEAWTDGMQMARDGVVGLVGGLLGQTERAPEGPLGLICDSSDALSCVGTDPACGRFRDAGGASMYTNALSFCTSESRREMVRAGFSDNNTCENQCAGVADVLGDIHLVYQETVFNALGGATMPSSSPGALLKVRAAIMNVMCGNTDDIRCAVIPGGAGEASCAGGEAAFGSLNPETLLNKCGTPLAVSVFMELTVRDPQAFVEDPASKMAVEAGIAAAASVEIAAVNAMLSLARRLDDAPRRLQSGAISVDATIHVEEAAEVADLQARVGAVQPDAMTTFLNTALAAANIQATVVVDDIAAEAAPTATETAAEMSRSDGSYAEDDAILADGAVKATVALGVVAVLAVVM